MVERCHRRGAAAGLSAPFSLPLSLPALLPPSACVPQSRPAACSPRRQQPDATRRLPVSIAPRRRRPFTSQAGPGPLSTGPRSFRTRRPAPASKHASSTPTASPSCPTPQARCVRACVRCRASGGRLCPGQGDPHVCLAYPSLPLLQGAILLVADSGSHVVRLFDACTGAALGVSLGGFGVSDGRLRFPFALAARDDGAHPPGFYYCAITRQWLYLPRRVLSLLLSLCLLLLLLLLASGCDSHVDFYFSPLSPTHPSLASHVDFYFSPLSPAAVLCGSSRLRLPLAGCWVVEEGRRGARGSAGRGEWE